MALHSPISYRTAEGEFAAQLPDVVEPRFWDGTPSVQPAGFTLNAGGQADLAASGELASRMRETFDRVGLVHVVNTGLTNLSDMRLLAKHALGDEMAYEGGSNPRDSLDTNVYEVGAPLSAWLHYHHEMAYIGRSTSRVAFLANKSVPGRGATYVSDGVATTDAILATDLGQKLKEKGVCYHRNMSDRDAYADRLEVGVYNHWQKSLNTEDPAEAQRRAEERGLVTEWGPERLLKTRYYVSAFEYFAPLDRNLLYCSVADHGMWFDAWPLVQHLPYEQRPLHLTFGDDTEFSEQELREFVDIYARFGMPIDWRNGDVAVICNYRFAHGRPSIHLEPGEDRELGVLLGAKYTRQGALANKW